MKLIDVRSPAYQVDFSFWKTWRSVVTAGSNYIRENLQKLPEEDHLTYFNREEITPFPAYVKACLREILTGIYTQMGSVIRQNGPKTLQTAILSNIDGAGTGLNYFLVMEVLYELLITKRVGICVDRELLSEQPTLAEVIQKQPYAYIIEAENLLAWHVPAGSIIPEEILIRDFKPKYHEGSQLLVGKTLEYRHMRRGAGGVEVITYSEKGDTLSTTVLNLKDIPMIILEVRDSIVQDVVGHQAAILNLMSTTIAYALSANMAVYTEQADMATLMASLQRNTDIETSEPNAEVAAKLKIGSNIGRRYAQNSERPDFISPPTDNIPKMLELIEKLRDDIRRIMLLSLQNVSVRGLTSVTALRQSQSTTNHGLATLAVLLEKAERGISRIWSDFEKVNDDYVVKYPNDFQLMSIEERLNQIDKLAEMQKLVPSTTYRQLIAKQITSLVLNQQLSAELRLQVEQEIKNAPSLVVRPDDVAKLVEEGVLPREYAGQLLNLPADTAERANQEHAERLRRIALAQMPTNARGNTDGADTSDLEKLTSQKGEQ